MFKRFLFFIVLLFCLNTHINAGFMEFGREIQETLTEMKDAAVDGMKTIGDAIVGFKRVMIGGEPIPEEKLLETAQSVYGSMFSTLGKDLNYQIEKGRDIVVNVMNMTMAVVSMIFILYFAFLVYRYIFFVKTDIMLYDYFNRQIKWLIIFALFFTQSIVLKSYDFFAHVDTYLEMAIFGTSFGANTLDGIAVQSFKVIIPIYNNFAKSGLLTDPFSFIANLNLLIIFSKAIFGFLSVCFSIYMTFKMFFIFCLMLFPMFGAFLIFEETREWFSHYISILVNLLIRILFIVIISSLFCHQIESLLDFYYNHNILHEGIIENLPEGGIKDTAEKVTDVAAFLTFGRLEYLILIAKLGSLVAIYVLAVLAVPQLGANLILGRLGRKKIGA